MKSQRSEARDNAYTIWRASKGKMPLVGIAELLGVPAVKVRKWKHEDDWDAKIGKKPGRRSSKKRKKSGSSASKKTTVKNGQKNSAILRKNFLPDEKSPPRKINFAKTAIQTKNGTADGEVKAHGNTTALLGNKNAVGHGAPKGNRNAVKTGEYQSVSVETMTKEELEVYKSAKVDVMEALDEEIRIQAVRRFRMEKLYKTMSKRKEDLDTTEIYEYEDRDTVVTVEDAAGEKKEAIVKKRQKLPARSVETRRTMDTKMLAAVQAVARMDRQRLSTLIEKAKLEQGAKSLELKERKINAEEW